MFAPDREPDADLSDSDSDWQSFPWEQQDSDIENQENVEPVEKRCRRVYRSESPTSEPKTIPLSPIPFNKAGSSYAPDPISPLIKPR